MFRLFVFCCKLLHGPISDSFPVLGLCVSFYLQLLKNLKRRHAPIAPLLVTGMRNLKRRWPQIFVSPHACLWAVWILCVVDFFSQWIPPVTTCGCHDRAQSAGDSSRVPVSLLSCWVSGVGMHASAKARHGAAQRGRRESLISCLHAHVSQWLKDGRASPCA